MVLVIDLSSVLVGSQGLVISFTNGLLLLTILSQKSLRKRKEMLIIAGLAGADLLYGLVALQLIIYRLVINGMDLQSEPMTAWDCVILPPIFLNYLTSLMISVMNLLVSIDRYMCVAHPVKYYQYDVRYAYRSLGGAALVAIFSFIFLLCSNYFGLERVYNFNRLCSGTLFPRYYMVYQFSVTALIGCIGVGIYIWVFVVYRMNVRKMHNQSTGGFASKSMINHQADTQSRLTVTLGIITFFSTILFVIPNIWLAIAFSMGVSFPSWLGTVIRTHSIVTIFVYIFRQREIRTGMWHMLTCKSACSRGSKTNVTTVGTNSAVKPSKT